jgi:hypothetical protein
MRAARPCCLRATDRLPLIISDADLDRALLEAGVPATTADAVVEVNANARIEALRVSLAVLAVLATIAIFMTRLLPTTPAGHRDHDLATD